MSTFAVIKTGGKQYKVSAGDKLRVEKISGESGDSVSFSDVLLVADGEKTSIGAPLVEGVSVGGKIIRQGRAKKEIIFKYHSKTRYRRKKGHRQEFTEVEIIKI